MMMTSPHEVIEVTFLAEFECLTLCNLPLGGLDCSDNRFLALLGNPSVDPRRGA